MLVFELSGKALDFAAFLAKGWSYWLPANAKWDDYTDWILSGGVLKRFCFDGSASKAGAWIPHEIWQPHCDWSQCGPIIDEARINLRLPRLGGPGGPFVGWIDPGTGQDVLMTGPSARTAILRCFVTHRLGSAVQIPEECLK